MKTISITDEQSDALCYEIACLVNEFRKDPNR